MLARRSGRKIQWAQEDFGEWLVYQQERHKQKDTHACTTHIHKHTLQLSLSYAMQKYMVCEHIKQTRRGDTRKSRQQKISPLLHSVRKLQCACLCTVCKSHISTCLCVCVYTRMSICPLCAMYMRVCSLCVCVRD